MASYSIRWIAADRTGTMPIPPKQGSALVAAREGLLTAVAIGEKLELILASYYEFQRELLELPLRDVVWSDQSWNSFSDSIREANRRIVHLLAVCRLYCDQVSHAVSRLYGDGSAMHELVKKCFRTEHSSSAAYRVMDALRNHSQHRDLFVASATFSLEAVTVGSDVEVEARVIPRLDVKALSADPRLKASILKELQAVDPERVDIRPFVSQYVEAMGRVHQAITALLASDTEVWVKEVDTVLKRVDRAAGGAANVVIFIQRDEKGATSEGALRELVDRLRHLQRRSRHAASLGNRYVTGRTLFRTRLAVFPNREPTV